MTSGSAALLGSNNSGTTLTIVNSIFVSADGLTTPVGTYNAGTLRVAVDYCGLPSAGPHKIPAFGGTSNTWLGPNNVAADPELLSLDLSDAAFLDVDSCAYKTAAQGGLPLRGGADFDAPCSAVDEWMLF
jgi:hypothetical protein